jgi:hypothetical protein
MMRVDVYRSKSSIKKMKKERKNQLTRRSGSWCEGDHGRGHGSGGCYAGVRVVDKAKKERKTNLHSSTHGSCAMVGAQVVGVLVPQ